MSQPSRREKIRQEVLKEIALAGSCPPQTLSEDAPLYEWGLDSLDAIELIMDLEDRFKIEISDEEGEALTSVRRILECVYRKVIPTEPN